MAKKLERDIERGLKSGVESLLRGMCLKWVSPGISGVPDRIVIAPFLPVWLVELKTETGKLSPMQKYIHNRLRALGANVSTLFGDADVEQWLLYRQKDQAARMRRGGCDD